MLLQYHNRFDIVAEFDPDTGQIDVLPRPQGLSVAATDGWFSLLSGVCVAFFRQAGQLRLRVGDRCFALDQDVSIEWHSDDNTSILKVADRDGEIALRYRTGPRSGPALPDDQTPFIDQEDWDLGLFVSNVMFDEERTELVRHGAG